MYFRSLPNPYAVSCLTTLQAVLDSIMVTITIPIPEGLDEASAHRAEQDAREAAGVRLYRDGQFSRGQLAKFLGLDRGQVDQVLDRHGVGILSGVTAREIAEQADTLRRLHSDPR